MKFILLSGGSGKRLWPVSNDSRSKQFVKLLDSENDCMESMIQRVWRQLEASDLAGDTLIATEHSQVDVLQSQLGEFVKIVIEPERRDTFPAIALATTYLYSVENIGVDEVVIVIPADLFAEQIFFRRLRDLETTLLESGAELALLGVKPDYPSELYGYIVPEAKQSQTSWLKVSRFQEKPTKEKARELIMEQALWNCGVFAFKLGYILAKLENYGLHANYPELRKNFGLLPKTSFDYEVAEKAEMVVAVCYEGRWKDLGTWDTFTEEVASPVIGTGFLSKDSSNTHLINELEIPIVVLGLSNSIIAASQDGILVADKKESSKVKELANGFGQRPMFEERRWGWYKVLDYKKYENGQEVLTKRVRITAGKNLSYQVHYQRSEVWNIIIGEGEIALEDLIFKVKPGDVLHIPIGVMHGIKADSDLEFIEIQTGTKLEEADIVRVLMTWEDVKNRLQ